MPYLPATPYSRLNLSIRHALIASLLTSVPSLPVWAASAAPTQQEQSRTYAITAGSLDQVLNRFASESGILLSADGTLTAGKRSPGLNGSYGVGEGLARLLVGTGLQAVNAGGNYALEKVTDVAGTMELSSVTISGKAPGSITEGTGSYTTGSTSSSTRLNLAPRDTPQSITVLTRQRMDDQKMDNLIDALDATTGVIIKPYSMGADAPQMWSRGSTINNFQIDGVPTSSSLANFLQSTVAYDRIEVVRGATGMMSGMGSPSATINMIRKRPTFEPQASVSLEAGNWDRYGSGFDVSGPLTETGNIRGRLVADYKTQHAWTDNYEQENTALYGITEFDITDDTLLTVGFNHLKKHTDSQTRLFPIIYTNGNRTGMSAKDNDSPDWAYYDHNLSSVFASVEHTFASGWSLKSELTHTQYKYDYLLGAFIGEVNQATGAGGRLLTNNSAATATQNNLDTYVTGTYPLFGREHEIISGVTLSELNSRSPSYSQTSATYLIPSIFDWAKTAPEPGYAKTGKTEINEYQYSAYVSTRFHMSDSTHLILGSRVTDWKRNRDAETYATARKTKTSNRESGVFIPYVGVTHNLDDTWSVYASYTKIFNPQAYDVRDINDQSLPPEEGTSYETGIKAAFMDSRFNASLALFKTEQDSLAVFDAVTRTYYLEDGTDSQGVELEFNGELAENWNFSTGYVYSVTRDSQDERILTRAPRHSLKTYTTYRLPGLLDKLTVGGGANWESKTGSDLGLYTQESHAVFNLMGRYDITRNLSASLNINNLFAKDYFVAVNGHLGVYGSPRSVMTSLKYNF